MCGIAGIFSIGRDRQKMLRIASQMAKKIQSRGPDASGEWVDEVAGIAFGHRRLSVLDLTPTGTQPMHSACNRYVTTFNGEIYNFKLLRDEITHLHPGHIWRGTSDTEVILAGVSYWGVQTTLTKLDGMFAIAVWDKAEQNLYLARDRMGEKPLYYGYVGKQFAFA